MTSSRREPKPVPVRRYRYSKLRWRILVHVLDVAGAIAMRLLRAVRPLPRVDSPRKILVVQLDHLGDAVLSSPLLARLRQAYPAATLDVLASPSNFEVFEADPNVDRVRLAARNWFERRQGDWALMSAVWELGRRLRATRYDLGIDVRGDVLSVIVLALAGIPRRVGWAMGGGAFLLTDVAPWVPGRHEVPSRLALLECLGLRPEEPARVVVHASEGDRLLVGQWFYEAWPDPEPASRGTFVRPRHGVPVGARGRHRGELSTERLDHAEPDLIHGGRFGASAPLLAVHLGAGTAAKRWPRGHWRVLIARFLNDGWRVVVIGGPEDLDAAEGLAHSALRDWTGRMTVPQTAAFLERADLFIGADSGPAHLAACAGITSVVLFSGTNRSGQWRPWSRRSLVLKHEVSCRPCHQKVCPLADHTCMSGLRPDRVYDAARRWWRRMHRQESPHAPL